MANQTLTLGTPAERVNFDSSTLSGLLNGETITINGGHLLIDGDNRWGSNAAVVDSMNISATLGGSIRFDGTQVWEVPFSAATGNVPAVADAGSNPITGTGITGELFRVWATGSLTPATPAGAMPATGWVKLRSKTGNFSNGLVVTLPGGATITCSGAGKRSWIHVVAEEGGTLTLPRLGEFVTRGDWHEIGTTNGADDQTFQYPVPDACPAIQIETAPGSNEYEWYLNAGDRWGAVTAFVPQDVRGKYFGMVNATGVITIARRATNACGFKPVSGCRVRIPNVILSNTTSAATFTTLTINGTLATRYDFTTTTAGVVDMEHVACNWYPSLTNAFRVRVANSSVLQSMLLSTVADTVVFDNVSIGLNSTNDFTPITISNCFTSVTLNKVRATRYNNNPVLSLVDVANYTETDCQFEFFGTTTTNRSATSVFTRSFSRLVGNNLLVRPVSIGSGVTFSTCVNLRILDMRYADLLGTATTATSGVPAVTLSSGCLNIEIDGFSNFGGLANVHPYDRIVSIATGSQGVKVQNIGTSSAPYDCGSANQCSGAVTASVMVGLELRRIYLQNTRSAPLSFANTVQNVVCDNVWGDGSDAQGSSAVNMLARGCRWTNSTTGSSSVYGRHWEDAFTSTTTGRLLIICNEPLGATADQCQITAGNAAFTSAGSVAMPAVGDQVTWTMPYFMLGVTGFANTLPTRSGANTANVSVEFQFDLGSGFNGAWLAATAANLSGIGAIDPNTGVKLMVRATTTVANTGNTLTFLRFDTVTDAVSQQIQYPLPGVPLVIDGLLPGSEVRVYLGTDPATAVELDGVESSGVSFTTSHTNAGAAGYVVIFANARQPLRIPLTFQPVAQTLSVQQTLDRVFENL